MSRTWPARSGRSVRLATEDGPACVCATSCRKPASRASAKEILCDGADVPLGTMPDFQRTITVAKALHPDTLLAYEMNGQPLPMEHGFPLRVIAPGWAGDSWVKWLQHIEVLDHEFEGFWMKSAYRHPTHPVAPGTAVDCVRNGASHGSRREVGHCGSRGWAKPGPVRIQGTAWSNSSPVRRVDVSTDGGQTWKPAKLGGQPTQYGWRLWQIDWKAAEGNYTLMARATNTDGQTQPLSQEWNPNGYLWNAVQPIAVTISAQAPSQRRRRGFHSRNSATRRLQAACFGCHDEHMMQQQHLNRAQWDREINKMTGWGAPLKPQNRDAVLDYLSNQFKQ